MSDVAAPERRTGILGQPQVLIGGKWLDADGPGVMEAYAKAVDAANSAQATTGRASSPPRAAKPVVVPSATSAAPARRGASTGPTARQREVWEAVQEHGTQAAAARALGISQGNVQSALKGYMRVMGIEGPLPGKSPKRAPKPKPETKVREPKPKPNGSDRFDLADPQPADHPGRSFEFAATQKATNDIAASATKPEPAPAYSDEWMREHAREPEPEPVAKPDAKYASDMHLVAPPPAREREQEAAAGFMAFLDINLEAAELATWEPDRLHALFAGIAAVEAALRDEPNP